MATILNNAAYMALPMNIKRGNPIPLDTTAVWYSKAELETYAASGATSYVGQVLTLVADGKCEAYLISNTAGTLIKLASTTASGDLASDVATLQSQVNDLVAKVGTAKVGETAATGLYKLIDDVAAIANGKVDSITAADSTIAIGGTPTAPTVKVQLSPDEDNAAKATANGLKVTLPTLTHPEYSIAQLKTPNNGMSASYSLTKNGVNVGAIINIPKDMVVKSGSVVVNPQGQSAGTYIELVLANATEDKLYVKVDDLIEYVTSGSKTGDMIVVSIDADHKVTASITDGTITEAKLTGAVRSRMAGVTSAATGTTNGTISVTLQTYNTETKEWSTTTSDVPVFGLKDAAYATIESLNATAQDKVDAAKAALVGASTDTSDKDTIKGAKAWGTAKADEALTAAKEYTNTEIGKLDYTDKTVEHQFVTEVSEINGKINVKRAALAAADIPTLGISKVDGLQDALDSKQGTVTFNTEYNAATNKAATMSDVNAAATALVGTVSDTKESDTIRGAKLYASDAAQAAKDYADGLVIGDTGVSARITALEGKVDVDKVSTAIAAAKTAVLGEKDYTHTVKDAYDLANGKTTLAAVKEYTDGKFQTVIDATTQHEAIAATVTTAQDAANEAKSGVAAINTKIGTVPTGKTIVGMITEATYDDTTLSGRVAAIEGDYLKAADKTTLQTSITGISDKVTTLIDKDAGKSVRTIANEELVKQLIPENASESLDTLQEIATWIQQHPADVTAMNKNITDLQAIVKGIGGTGEKATVVAYVDDKITALKIEDYAKTTELNAVAGRVTAAEAAITTLEGKSAQWDAAQANVIESIKIGNTALAIASKAVTIPYGSNTAFGVMKADNASLSATDGVISIKAVNAATLYVAEGDTLIINGGSAASV